LLHPFWGPRNITCQDIKGTTNSDGNYAIDAKLNPKEDSLFLEKGGKDSEYPNQLVVRKDDNSVWADLTNEGLDQKLLLRSDGTSVYMTQDLGTAVGRFEDNDIQKLIYTVGNEQDYHFQV